MPGIDPPIIGLAGSGDGGIGGRIALGGFGIIEGCGAAFIAATVGAGPAMSRPLMARPASVGCGVVCRLSTLGLTGLMVAASIDGADGGGRRIDGAGIPGMAASVILTGGLRDGRARASGGLAIGRFSFIVVA